ncbi:MAG: hypothetical protein HOQ05_07365 [Corynebacteriales bacterium]|nr:hypothetical protein [Mycobacteriales bacterium]
MIASTWAQPPLLDGTLLFTPAFERVIADLQTGINSVAGAHEPHWCPPVVPVALLERAEYTESFPQLLGTVHAFDDTERLHDSVVLAPAVCYHVYAQLADRVIERPELFNIAGYCYRHESTTELGRFRTFRMREQVMVGRPELCQRWRAEWIERTEKLLNSWGLAVRVEQATDPFFGPGGRVMNASQLEQGLKFEFVAPVSDDDPGTAIASANYHTDHLGTRFGIANADGSTAHSACMAFGLERIALALIHAHGNDRSAWPNIAGGQS